MAFYNANVNNIIVSDINKDGVKDVAEKINGTAITADVTNEKDIIKIVNTSIDDIDIFCSNVGIGGYEDFLKLSNDEWRKMIDTNLMSHIYGVRHVLPKMLDRGSGYLVFTASAAGLLSQLGSVTYSVTKHAAVSLSEFLAISYREHGIKVSVLCPQSVETDILENSPTRDLLSEGAASPAAVDGVLKAEEVAQSVVEGVREEKFHILPHPEVSEYARRKSDDIDRWLAGMHRFQQKLFPAGESPSDWLIS